MLPAALLCIRKWQRTLDVDVAAHAVSILYLDMRLAVYNNARKIRNTCSGPL
jgi:hypothetical protein